MSYKHFKIHSLVRFRVIEDPHNNIHNLGLYSCEKVVSGKLVMLVLFTKLANRYLKVSVKYVLELVISRMIGSRALGMYTV